MTRVGLRTVPCDVYARDVLPLTQRLWAGRRTFDDYVAQTREVARSRYGARNFRTVGLYEGAALLASFKRYERTIRNGEQRLRAIGIGAVFTPPEHRSRGYASVMLAAELDRSRAAGCDIAYLFSDIRPQFYAELGFRQLPSRRFTMRADGLGARRVRIAFAQDGDWSGIRRCFESAERARTYGFVRSEAVWDWIRLRSRQNCEHPFGHSANVVLRAGRSVRAYVLGARAPERDTYLLDEFGYADDEAAQALPALLRAAAGDLRRIAGWLPPHGAKRLPGSAAVTARTRSILMMAPLSQRGARLVRTLGVPSHAGFCWPSEHI